MEYSFTQYLSSLPRTPVVEAVQSLYESVDLDDNLAAKFAQTSQDIYKATVWVANKIKEFGEDFITYMKQHLDSEKDRYNATIQFDFAEMGLSEDFVKLLPPKLYIRFVRPEHSIMYPKSEGVTGLAYADTAGLMADLDDGCAEYALIGIFIHPGMDTTDSIVRIIRWKLPHELRHIVDTCDSATLKMMEDNLNHNTMATLTNKFTTYWDDPGEYYARMSEVVALAINGLSKPEMRQKFHSAKEAVDSLSSTRIYQDAVGDVDDTAKAAFKKNLELILAKIMDKLV